MDDAIRLRGVTKSFGPKMAVRDLDLSIPGGALYGLIGPNGAGKTTTIRMVMSILFPDRGEIRVLGHRSALEAKDRIGYLPEERGVYKKMSVGRFLGYVARLKGVRGAEVRRCVGSWLERVGLEEVERKRCEELSKGMQQKVQFIAAVLHDPELLILDEPFSGLDPINMRLLRELIAERHRAGTTVIFSTHVMAQAEQICDHIVMIHDGLKRLDAPLTEIRAAHDPRLIYLEPLDPTASPGGIGSLPQVVGVGVAAGRWAIELAEGIDPAAAMRALIERVPASRVEIHRPTLEDVFVEIAGAPAADGTGDAVGG